MQKKELKNNKGITLIALIITIIVMLILVGVTVSQIINGNLFGTAKKGAKSTEKESIYETIMGAMAIDSNGKIAVEDTYNNAKKALNDYTVKPETVSDDTKEVVLEVTGNYGEIYYYQITETGIMKSNENIVIGNIIKENIVKENGFINADKTYAAIAKALNEKTISDLGKDKIFSVTGSEGIYYYQITETEVEQLEKAPGKPTLGTRVITEEKYTDKAYIRLEMNLDNLSDDEYYNLFVEVAGNEEDAMEEMNECFNSEFLSIEELLKSGVCSNKREAVDAVYNKFGEGMTLGGNILARMNIDSEVGQSLVITLPNGDIVTRADMFACEPDGSVYKETENYYTNGTVVIFDDR